MEFASRADLGHAAVEHHRDPVGEHGRLLLIVGDDHGGDLEVTLHIQDQLTHAVAQVGVEAGQRLVEEQHPRLDDQRPGESDPLALPTGQLLR